MHHVVMLIAERHGGTCTNQSLSRFFERYASKVQGLLQNYNRVGVSLELASLVLRGRGKTVYIYPPQTLP
ncbi:hypothetical protein Hanom_Chr15g01365591 [Helianthus anomalus]